MGHRPSRKWVDGCQQALQFEETPLRKGVSRHCGGMWTAEGDVVKGRADSGENGRSVYMRALGPGARIGK